MSGTATTVQQYLNGLPEDRSAALQAVRAAVNRGLPRGYREGIQYGMIGWYVPHALYPDGYHCNPKIGVPFASLASQKNHMALYLNCIYSSEKDRAQFEKDWAKSGKKLDMGKSCIRFKRLEDLPLDVITAAVKRVPITTFLAHYEAAIGSRKKPAKKKTTGAGPAKKAAGKKAASKKARAKKPVAKKKAVAKKAAAKKKAVVKKAVVKKKAASRKSGAKQTVAKKRAVSKKAAVKTKTPGKKAVKKRAAAKTRAKKGPARKTKTKKR